MECSPSNSGKPRQRTARTGHNLHRQAQRLNRGVDVENFRLSGNESYSGGRSSDEQRRRREEFEKERAAKDGFQASQTAKAWRGPPCAVTPVRDYDRSSILRRFNDRAAARGFYPAIAVSDEGIVRIGAQSATARAVAPWKIVQASYSSLEATESSTLRPLRRTFPTCCSPRSSKSCVSKTRRRPRRRMR